MQMIRSAFCVCLFFLASLLHSEEIEIRLRTSASLTPVYISRVYADASPFDWRYWDEIRSVLEFDIATGGYASVLTPRSDWENGFSWPDPRQQFDLPLWKREKIPFVLALSVYKNALQVVAFDVEKGSSKRYPELVFTGRVEEDRKQIHRLADAIHLDLFRAEGIASLRIIYSQRLRENGAEPQSEIWVSDADGANPIQVTREGAYSLTPAFYPHTAGLANPPFFFVSFQNGQSKIYRSHLNGGKPTPVVELRGSQALPALNARGTLMAFIADAAGRPDLFVQAFDNLGRAIGKSRQLFTSPRATQASPTFSPDGKKIAFVSDKDGPPRIYVVDVLSPRETKRVRPQLLTTKNRENTCPSWSPDGTKLAYSAKVENTRQIWIYDFKTQEESPLTFGPLNKENPCWAPDSLHLVYNTDDDEQGELYLIDLHRREPVQISRGAGQKRFPAFETR